MAVFSYKLHQREYYYIRYRNYVCVHQCICFLITCTSNWNMSSNQITVNYLKLGYYRFFSQHFQFTYHPSFNEYDILRNRR
jgi:hypothetical protein